MSVPQEDRMIRIRNGFFWVPEEGAAIKVGDGVTGFILRVEGCRFVSRPKRWWHIRAWYRAWRLWLGHNDWDRDRDTWRPR